MNNGRKNGAENHNARDDRVHHASLLQGIHSMGDLDLDESVLSTDVFSHVQSNKNTSKKI